MGNRSAIRKIEEALTLKGYNGVVLIIVRPTKKVGPCIYIEVERSIEISLLILIIYECNFRY